MSALLGLMLALLAVEPGDETEVAVLDRGVARGELIEAGDFVLEPRSTAAARGALAIDEAAGMEAARNLSAGAVVRRRDIVEPQLVRRGEPVTIRIVSGALVITASGRALASGARGDAVRVVANSTNRTLDGTVESAGTVRIATP